MSRTQFANAPTRPQRDQPKCGMQIAEWGMTASGAFFHSAFCILHSAFQFRSSAVRQFGSLLFALFVLAIGARAADCLSIDEAPTHIGQMACVTGKVLKVGESRAAHYLDFCANYRRCPFTVVIFKKDIKDDAILKQFPGKVVRIYGPSRNTTAAPKSS